MRTLLLLLITAAPAFGQKPYNPFSTTQYKQPSARARRATRERAVAFGGLAVRPLVESAFGDEAARAVLSCSKDTSVRLAEFYTAGGMAKWSRPAELMIVLAEKGQANDCVNWITQPQHARLLDDRDNFEAFLQAPMDYVLGLAPLETAGSELRAQRLAPAPSYEPVDNNQFVLPANVDKKTAIGIGCGLVLFIGIIVLLRRKS